MGNPPKHPPRNTLRRGTESKLRTEMATVTYRLGMDIIVGHELLILSTPNQPIQAPPPRMCFSNTSMKKPLIKVFVAIQLPFL